MGMVSSRSVVEMPALRKRYWLLFLLIYYSSHSKLQLGKIMIIAFLSQDPNSIFDPWINVTIGTWLRTGPRIDIIKQSSINNWPNIWKGKKKRKMSCIFISLEVSFRFLWRSQKRFQKLKRSPYLQRYSVLSLQRLHWSRSTGSSIDVWFKYLKADSLGNTGSL